MKRILTTMCALTLLLAASVPALAVEPEQSASYYPTSVEEYMEGDSPRIKKVYQLSLADDPSQMKRPISCASTSQSWRSRLQR